MAARRWEIDSRMRARLAATEPAQFSGKIIRRIVVIERESIVREAVIYDFDSARSARRKLRSVLVHNPLLP